MIGQRQVSKEKGSNGLFLLFIIWPFLSFLLALANFGNKKSRSIVIAFFAFFGFTMNLGREGLDGNKHAETFKMFGNFSYEDLSKIIYDFFANLGRSNKLDIYTLVANFSVSRFTDSYHYVFLLHALIYSIFSIKLFELIYDEFNGNLNKNSFVFFAFLFFLLPISNVHGIRFPIATCIFIYGAYKYISTQKLKAIIWCAVACLVHFSFVLALLIIIAYHFIGNKNVIYISLLVLSYIVPNLLANYIIGFDVSIIGEEIEGKISGYSREEYIEARNQAIEGRNWYVKYRIPILQYVFFLVLFIINFVRKRNYFQDETQKNLFSFLILFLAFVNFGFAFDSLGRRFLLIWFVFATIYLFRFFQLNYYKKYSGYTIILIFPIILWIIVQVRVAFYITTYMWFFGNPLLAVFVEMEAIFAQ